MTDGPRPAPPRSDPVTTPAGRVRVDDVTVVVLTRPDGPLLDGLLDALAAQSRRPQRLVLTGTSPDDPRVPAARNHPLVREQRVPLLVRPVPADAAAGPDAPGGASRGPAPEGDRPSTAAEPPASEVGGETPHVRTPASDAGITTSDVGTAASDAGIPTSDVGTAPPDARVATPEGIPAPHAPPRWRAVEDARAILPMHPDHWVWLLPDDSLPEPSALSGLVAAVRRNSRVGMVGPKLVRADDPRLLVAVGHHLTPAGRQADGRSAALVDQGQLDLRQDVLGVPLVGSLVRSDALEGAGGLSAEFGDDGVDGLDLGWRAHLTGHRVVVAPDAVVRTGDEGLGVRDPRRTRIRQRQLALARGSAWTSPWRALGVLLTSTLAALLLLLVKRPAEAADEWADVRAVLSPARGMRARWRFRSRRTVRPGDLHALFLPTTAGWRSTLDTVGDALDPRTRRPGRRTGPAAGGRAVPETGPVSDELAELTGEDRRTPWTSWPLALALLAVLVATAWTWRERLGDLRPGGAGPAGGELGAAAAGSGDLWRSALDGWRGGGLGHDHPPEPWLLPWAGLTRVVEAVAGAGGAPNAAGVALGWILLASAPVALLTAYVALRRVTRRRWLRAVLALGWSAATPLVAAVGEGRVGPVVVHLMAPLLAAGFAVAATRGGGVRRTAAVFATALAVALTAQWVPAVLLPATVAGILLLALGRGVRWRGAVLALLPWALLLPWVPAMATDPVRLVGGAGATAVLPGGTTDVPAWQTTLLAAGGPVDPAGLQALPLWAALVWWLAALAGTALPGRAGRRAAVLVGGALLTLLLALTAGRAGLGVLPAGHAEAGLDVGAWPGTMLSLTGASLLLATALLVDRSWRSHGPRRGEPLRSAVRRPRALATAVAAVLVVLAALVPAAVAVWRPAPSGLEQAAPVLPPVAAAQADGPSAPRTLVLSPAGPEVVVDLVGREIEPARVLRDRTAELAVGVRPPGPVEEVAAAVVGGGGEETLARLHGLAVGYVLVTADDDDPLVTRVDALPGLTRVGGPPGQVLWRMADNVASRVRVLDATGELVTRVDSTGPHGTATDRVEDLPEGSVLDVAEGPGWTQAARVSVDGADVPVGDDGIVALPAGSHDLDLWLARPALPWHLVALLLAAVTAFLALPFGRPEPETPEEDR
ncbi:glycosyltransferase [Ornithinimicrobium sp. W1665]